MSMDVWEEVYRKGRLMSAKSELDLKKHLCGLLKKLIKEVDNTSVTCTKMKGIMRGTVYGRLWIRQNLHRCLKDSDQGESKEADVLVPSTSEKRRAKKRVKSLKQFFKK